MGNVKLRAVKRPAGYRGGMATVYVAEDVKHHRTVAIKVLDRELAANLGPERVIETAARLQHPHIVPLLDLGGAGDTAYSTRTSFLESAGIPFRRSTAR